MTKGIAEHGLVVIIPGVVQHNTLETVKTSVVEELIAHGIIAVIRT